MPFNCFKYNNLYNISSKRYHTAAKQSAAFFDSSFNHIKQNSQVVVTETFSQGAKRVGNPHPVNSISANYLQLDYLNDENKLKNPINIVPYNQDSVILSVHKNDYQQVIKKLPVPQNSLVSQLNTSFQKQSFHTQTQAKQAKQNSADSSPTLVDPIIDENDKQKYFEPVFEQDQEQSDETFLNTQINEIERSFEAGQFERINSYYMALKRNNIVPSREIFTKVLYSICQRTIDDSSDDQLSVLLNVYQDMISNKIKPDLAVYSIVINQLLEGSIKAAYLKDYSTNGADFFKIAIDIFNASNCSHFQQFDTHLIDQILVGMNIYPGFVNSSSFIAFLKQQEHYKKTHIYYSSLINYCKYTNDSQSAVQLYEEFKTASLTNEELNNNQFIIYSAFISTLIETDQISLATKFMDKLLTSIKIHHDYESKVKMLLSSYLLTLSKQNPSKAFEIWAQFNRIDWIPEFSYTFYLNMLHYSLSDYRIALKLYNYMTALPQAGAKQELDTLLISPQYVDSISEMLLLSIENSDKSTVLKILKESLIRKTSFRYETYNELFGFINNEDLIIRITNSHGLVAKDGFEFLTFLTSTIPNFPIYEISRTEFMKKLVDDYTLEKSGNYYGFYQVFQSIFQTNEINEEMLELISPLVLELHDLNNYYVELNSQTAEFKSQLTNYFITLVDGLEVNVDELSSNASDAIRLIKNLRANMNEGSTSTPAL